MGVDQRSGELHVVIMKWVGQKRQLIHLEIIDNHASRYLEAGKIVSPFKRLYTIMKEFDVDMCILDALPNANEAKEFAATFPGRVFLAYYKQSQDMAQWSDKKPRAKDTEKAQLRRSSKDIKFPWVVMLDRYKSIEYALRQIRKRKVIFPNPKGLVQEVRDPKTGVYQPEHVCEAIFFLHLKSVVRELVQSKIDGNTIRYRWRSLGLDPHFCHAFTYGVLAGERRKKVFAFDFL